MKEIRKEDEVLYLALRDAMRDLKDPIIECFYRIYGISDEERSTCQDFYSVSDMLEMAYDFVAELEDYDDKFEDKLI